MRAFALYCGNAEPSLVELLSDPIMDLLLARDGIEKDEVRELMTRLAQEQCRHYRKSEPISWLAACETEKA